MKKISVVSLLILACVGWNSLAVAGLQVKSFSLTESGPYVYDASVSGPKTEAQKAVDYMYEIGVRHVLLTPYARMSDGTTTAIVPATPPGLERSKERQRYLRFIKYIKSKQMTVGIRPIILVNRDPNNNIWHGNISPISPAAWFDSLRAYLDIYANIAKAGAVEEFTVGAELFSMTVGVEDQWTKQPYGFPREWTILIRDLKAKFGAKTRIMYDINYTDMTVNSDGTGASGGEIERWRYRLADLKPQPDEAGTASAVAWEQLKQLWEEIDVIGIDIYRSLVPRGTEESVPQNYQQLVAKLQEQAEQYASDIDAKLFEIECAVGFSKPVIIKETGFKSCQYCFIDPFTYDDPRKQVNIEHQAAAYEATFNAFVAPNWPWLMGMAFWDISTDPARSGPKDPGFSPRGKALTEEVIRRGWGD